MTALKKEGGSSFAYSKRKSYTDGADPTETEACYCKARA